VTDNQRIPSVRPGGHRRALDGASLCQELLCLRLYGGPRTETRMVRSW
jgi:hypothetical protein